MMSYIFINMDVLYSTSISMKKVFSLSMFFSLTTNYLKYKRIFGTKLASLENDFHYKSNITNNVNYNQGFGFLKFFGQSSLLKYVCALLIQTEVVDII
jgi:hypothetical protein